MSEVVFITADDARYGFSLAGTQQLTTAPEQAEELLCRTISDSSVAVVVIDERLVQSIESRRFSELERHWRGLLVTLPTPERDVRGEEDYLQRLIRRVLGYHVRLQL